MNVQRKSVLKTLTDPETDYPSTGYSNPNVRVAVRGGLAVVYDSVDMIIITVLWHKYERWER